MGKILTLGEIMLRLSTTTDTRLSEADQLNVHYGGAEANIAISLANYNHEVSFASTVPNNALGLAAKRHLQRFGVSTRLLHFGGDRLGCYYLENGIGQRASAVLYDRAHSSFAEMNELYWSWDDLFDDVELFHVSGITPAVSNRWADMTLQLMREARKRKIKVSFDVNYRSGMWSQDKAKVVLAQLLPYVDYCSAGMLDAVHLIGINKKPNKDQDELVYYYQQMQDRYPNVKLFYSTIRQVQSTSYHILTGTIWKEGQLYASNKYVINPIVDRVGGGDAFSAGVLHGLLTKKDMNYMVSFATAASVLKHTVYGDCNHFLIREIEAFMYNMNQEISR